MEEPKILKEHSSAVNGRTKDTEGAIISCKWKDQIYERNNHKL
jgi:hypothetical protein